MSIQEVSEFLETNEDAMQDFKMFINEGHSLFESIELIKESYSYFI